MMIHGNKLVPSITKQPLISAFFPSSSNISSSSSSSRGNGSGSGSDSGSGCVNGSDDSSIDNGSGNGGSINSRGGNNHSGVTSGGSGNSANSNNSGSGNSDGDGSSNNDSYSSNNSNSSSRNRRSNSGNINSINSSNSNSINSSISDSNHNRNRNNSKNNVNNNTNNIISNNNNNSNSSDNNNSSNNGGSNSGSGNSNSSVSGSGGSSYNSGNGSSNSSNNNGCDRDSNHGRDSDRDSDRGNGSGSGKNDSNDHSGRSSSSSSKGSSRGINGSSGINRSSSSSPPISIPPPIYLPPFPSPTILSFNINGLSAYAKHSDIDAKIRSRNIIKYITTSINKYQIICLQETKLFKLDFAYLNFLETLHGCQVLYNNHPSNTNEAKYNRASTVTILSPTLLKTHSAHLIPLDSSQNGHLQVTHLIPKNGETHHPFQVINAYITTHGGARAKIESFNALRTLPNDRHSFLCGDFNCVFRAEDSTSSSTPPPTIISAWRSLSDHLGLSEAYQPTHTFYRIPEDPKTSSPFTARYDRIYHSLSEAALAITTPTAVLYNRPTIKRQRDDEPQTHASSQPADHLPIALTYVSTSPPPKRAFKKIPNQIARLPAFREGFRQRWHRRRQTRSPIAEWKALKATIRVAAIDCHKKERADKSTLGQITALTNIIRFLSSPSQTSRNKATALASRFGLAPPSLSNFSPSPFLDALNTVLKEAEVEPPPSNNPPPQDASPPKLPSYNFIKEIKPCLPSTRPRLRALRPDLNTPPSSDPAKMGEYISSYYGSLWSLSESPSQDLDDFLKRFPKSIDLDLIQAPSRELVNQAIINSGNSSTGPDGIPFTAYRTLIDYAAPLLFNLINHLGRGGSPANDFNLGLLHLIPKKETLLPQHTRPITVGNTDNRLTATVLILCIVPAIQAFITPNQRLFVPGRDMAELVRSINELFYSNLSKKQLKFLFFLDTEKAFDSIHHDFILAVLKHLKFPPWFLNIAVSLLSKVAVSPVLANSNTLWIDICRGVKQGCPLSPILFILCFEFLLLALADDCPDALSHAAADDLAIFTPSITTIFQAMLTINTFSGVSGLGVNMDKSAILPTLTSELKDIAAILSISPWPKITLATTYTHLGVLLGHRVWTEHIYKKAHNKAISRIESYHPVLRALTIPKRIAIINTFVTSLYLYLGTFFIIPRSYRHQYDMAVQQAVIPLGGTAFKRLHLLKAVPHLHFKPPLRDLWAANLSSLASHFPFQTYDQEADEFPYPWIYENSCRVTEHCNFAGKEFLKLRNENPAASSTALSKDTSSPRTMYNRLVVYGYRKTAENDWVRKLGKLGIPTPTNALANITNHFSNSVSPKIPNYTRSFFLSHLLNALTTTQRMHRFYRHPVIPCPFCNVGPDLFDHFFTECPVVGEALTTLPIWTSLQLPVTLPPALVRRNLFTLAIAEIPANDTKIASNLLVYLPAALWILRKSCIAKGNTTNLPKLIEDQINGSFKLLNKASTKRPKDTKKAIQAIEEIPKDATIAYTDGSANPNPGPAGAGAIITSPSFTETCLFQALGHGTNNVGEFWAIGLVIEFLANNSFTGPLYICSDSKVAIGILSQGHRAKKKTRDLASSVARRIAALQADKGTIIRFIWTPGHCGIHGNEVADRLADMGTRLSRLKALPPTPVLQDAFPARIAPIKPIIF